MRGISVGHLRIQREVLVAGIELHRYRGFGDGDAFLHRARFQDDVHGDVTAHLHGDVFLDELAEARVSTVTVYLPGSTRSKR